MAVMSTSAAQQQLTEADGSKGFTTGDVVLAAAVAGVLVAVIALSKTAPGTGTGVAAYAFAVGFGAVLLLRRTLPVTVVVLSALATFAYYTLGLPPIGVALPVAAALYSAAEQGRTRSAEVWGAVVLLVALGFRLRDDPQPVRYLLGTDATLNIALICAAIALGYAVRARRIQAAQQKRIDRLAREQAAGEMESRLRAEREAIWRDSHDSVGHALSVIVRQASAGQDAVGTDDDAVAAALTQVRSQATVSLRELRGLVCALRGSSAVDEETRHGRSLADLASLVAEAGAAGLKVSCEVDLDDAGLSPAVDATAFRVIQESLTNVMRHSGADSAKVSVVVADGRLHVVVSDDGRGADGDSTGPGIAGMTERVRLLGGTLRAGDGDDGGCVVEVWLPVRIGA